MLPNKTYCPNCAVNEHRENEDVCYDFNLHVKVTEPGLLEVSCARCGEGAIYVTTFLKTTHRGKPEKAE